MATLLNHHMHIRKNRAMLYLVIDRVTTQRLCDLVLGIDQVMEAGQVRDPDFGLVIDQAHRNMDINHLNQNGNGQWKAAKNIIPVKYF